MTSDVTPLLEVRSVVKGFPGVRALKGVSLTLHRGEMLAVIGENGAGKSTLMKILAGVQQPDAGEIRFEGRPVVIPSVHAAMDLGISLIHQELNLCDNLDLGANIFLGREPRRMGLIDKRTIRRKSRVILDRIGLQISPRTLLSRLSVGQQQMVEIAKAVSTEARVLIMDEPTSSLSLREAEALFEVIRELLRQQVSVVYISHRLAEVQLLAHRVVVLRDGENAGELARTEITHDRMVQMMVGRDISRFYSRKPRPIGDEVLRVEKLVTPAHPTHQLSLSLRAGEIVGVAGLVGAGRTELLETLFGVTPALAGEIRIAGRPVPMRSPLDAIGAGLGLVPEDRKQQGLVLAMTVSQNMGLAGAWQHRKALARLNRGWESTVTADMIKRLRIKTPSPRQVVQLLSGGNQQKVVLGKWLSLQPRILLLDEPTRGIDIGAKEEIYKLMEELAEQGVAILFVSSEMEEILGMSDRTLVMHEGRLTGCLTREQLSEEAVMQLATGREQSSSSPVGHEHSSPAPAP